MRLKSLILLLLVAITYSCKEKCVLPEQIMGTGEIIPNAKIYQPDFIYNMPREGVIMQSESDNIYNLKVSFDNSTSYEKIDFEKYTVLGKYADARCEGVMERSITKDDTQKKYIYKVTVHQCGACERLMVDMNWVLVLKIRNGYEVDFVVK